jgi:hypothetical protein
MEPNKCKLGFFHFAPSVVDVSAKTSNFKKTSWKQAM